MRRCKRLSDHRTVAYRHWLPIGVSPALAFAENGIDVAHQHAAKEWLGQEVLDASLPDRVAQLRLFLGRDHDHRRPVAAQSQSVDQLEMTRDGKINALEGQITVADGQIREREALLERQRASAAKLERSGGKVNEKLLKDIATTLSPGQPVYVLVYASAIIFFCFFLTFKIKRTRQSDNGSPVSGPGPAARGG